jgi:hypothetical protein
MPKPRTNLAQDAGQMTTAARQHRSPRKVAGRDKRNEPSQFSSSTADERPSPHRPASTAGLGDERESLVNEHQRGLASEIAVKVSEVTSIRAFMLEIDIDILDPDACGAEAVASPEAFFESHVSIWLLRDPVLSRAEVRDSGHGLHVLLWLDEPIRCDEEQAKKWDAVAYGIRNVLPCDPRGPGLIAMSRPVGAMNTKHEPHKEVRQLRAGQPISRGDIEDLAKRLADAPSRLWMALFHGGERVQPCPLCCDEGTSLGVAGEWMVRCYECGRVDAAVLLYRHFTRQFLEDMEDNRW